MNKQEFLNQLRGCLYALPPEEREAALEYYNEYFDDAGPENEQRVIKELGSPQQVAQQILASCGERFIPPAYAPAKGARPGARRFAWWWVLIGVIAFPILFPLIIAVLSVLFVLIVVAFVLLLVLAVVTVALIVGGVVGVVAWIVGLGGVALPFITVPPGLWGLGSLLVMLGLGLLLVWPCAWLIGRGIPLFWQYCRKWLRR